MVGGIEHVAVQSTMHGRAAGRLHAKCAACTRLITHAAHTHTHTDTHTHIHIHKRKAEGYLAAGHVAQ